MAYISFQPKDYYATKLYNGSADTQTISGVGFEPAFTMFSHRNGGDGRDMYDIARGAGERIRINATSVENDRTGSDSLSAWTSDGFTLIGANNANNASGGTYVSWNWKGGTTTGIDTTGSTITPAAYSFNATSGFSVIKYTGNATAGAKVPHGLGAAPEMMYVKNLDDGNDWKIYSKSMTDTDPEDYLVSTNLIAAKVDDATVWNDTQPDTVNFTLGNSTHVNDSSTSYVAYCFASKPGFSKIGHWIGNNSGTIGPYIYTGFEPSFVLLKVADYSAAWTMFDNKRDGYNPTNKTFTFNTSSAETTNYMSDIYSNGFQPRGSTDPQINQNGSRYIYMAFAENPIVSSNDIPGLAK